MKNFDLNSAHPSDKRQPTTTTDVTVVPAGESTESSEINTAKSASDTVNATSPKKRPMSDEGRRNISVAMKLSHANRKAAAASSPTEIPFVHLGLQHEATETDKPLATSATSSEVVEVGPINCVEVEPAIDGERRNNLPPVIEAASPAEITADLLERCRAFICSYVIVPDTHALVMAVWVLHTYVFSMFKFTPYLNITSPMPACGKTNLLDTLASIAARPISSGSITRAALLGAIDAQLPTLFIDEMDTKNYEQSIRAVLNIGFKKGGAVSKSSSNGGSKTFNVYCPKCFAGIGRLSDTVTSRSLVIQMRRKLPTEQVSRFRDRDVQRIALPLRVALAGWASEETMGQLRAIDPTPITELGDRQNDIVEPLLAITQLAEGDWLDRLTQALQSICMTTVADVPSIEAMLLSDIREAFCSRGTNRMPSVLLCKYLSGIEGHPWADLDRHRGMSPNYLARQLQKFGISPRSIRMGENDTPKGYLSCDFEKEWARYCPLP